VTISAASSTSAVTDAAPTVTTPVITGTAQEGQILTASASSSQSDNLISYQWKLSTNGGSTWSNISGATSSTYQVKEADEGAKIEVVATVKNDNGVSVSATSTATATVTDKAPTVTKPTVTGTAQEGKTLTASASSGQSDNPVTYAWYSSASGYSTVIGTGSTYTLKEGDEGAQIEVVATATNDNGVKASATSTPTLAVTDVTLTPTIVAGTNTAGKPTGTATFTVTFAEAVTGLTAADFSIFGTANSGTPPTIQSVSASSGTSFTVTVTYRDTGTGSHGHQSLGLNFVNNTNVHDSEHGESNNLAVATNYSTPQFSSLAPAGVAGQPINLGLTSPSAGLNGLMAITVTGLPSNWNLNEGLRNSDGSWTVNTADPSSLTVTPPATFVGAAVVQINETWTSPDGSLGSTVIADNVEAYAPGSPIFALSSDDHLTGGGGNDLFVFSKPIRNDTINSFNTASDKIDLVGFAGLKSFSDVQANLVDDATGDAVITVGSGETITLYGVSSASLSANNFAFDQTPIIQNPGTMSIGDGAILPLGGIINNTGTIALNSMGDETDLEVHGLTLQGGGRVILSDNTQNVIYGSGTNVSLTNLDNTISGAGQLGEGQLSLVNDATIDATGTNALVIDTGNNVIANAGTLEATGRGGLTVNSAVSNSGQIWADGGNVDVQGAATGNGTAMISGSATLEFGATSAENTSFAAGAAGTLKLDQAESFSGSVSGFGAGDTLDLSDIAFGANLTIGYTANAAGTGGSLSISDGTHSASVALLGQFAAAGFQVGSDAGGGAMVTYAPPDQTTGPLITPPKS
jgi:hypothetical protein